MNDLKGYEILGSDTARGPKNTGDKGDKTMAAFASAAAQPIGSAPLGPRSTAHSDQVSQHDFSHTDEAWDGAFVRELARELAATLAIELSDAALENVRTREQLIELVFEELARSSPGEDNANDGSTLRVRITSRNSPAGWHVERSLPWTPYSLDTIWDDAVHAGSGSVVDVTTPYGTPRSSIVRLEQRFAPLRYRGVRVRVRPDIASRS